MNHKSIQILRGSATYDPKTSNEVLLDGQPFYSKKTKQLYIGDGITELRNLEGTAVGLNLETGEGLFSLQQKTHIDDAKNPKATGLGSVAFGGFRGDKPNGTPVTLPTFEEETTDTLIDDTTSLAAGIQSTVFGAGNRAWGNWDLIAGKDNVTFGKSSFAFGNGNIAGDKNNNDAYSFAFAFGADNIVPGNTTMAWGTHNKLNGLRAMALGHYNEVLTGESVAVGRYNVITGGGAYAFGQDNDVSGLHAYGIGTLNTVTGTHGVAIGRDNKNYAHNGYAFGGSNKVGFANQEELDAYNNTYGVNIVAPEIFGDIASHTFVGGYGSSAASQHSFNWGYNLINNSLASAAFGAWNEGKTDMVLELGWGSRNSRKNVFEVTNTGVARAYGKPVGNNDVVRLVDLNNAVNEASINTTIDSTFFNSLY